jgi:hypothetical protein
MGDPNIAKAYLDTLKIYGGMSDLKISQDFGEKWLSLNIREQLLLLEFCMHDEQFFARCESLLAQFLKADVMQEKWWHAGTVNRGILVSAGLEAKFKSGVDVREKKAEEQEKQQKRRLISDFGAAINACFEEKDGVKLNEAASAFMKKVGDCTSQEINVQELLQNHLKSLPPVSKVRVLYLINSVAQSQGKIGIQFAVSPAIENLVKMVRSEEALLTLKPEDLTDQELKIFIQIVGEDEISHENLRKIQDSLRLEASKRASVKSTREIYINNHGARKSLVYGLSYGTFMRTLSGVLNLSRYIDQQMRVSDGNSEKPSTEELIERLILGFAPEELQELMHSNNLHRLAGIIEALANANDDKTVRAHEVAKALYSTLTKNNVEKPASITVSPEKFDSARHAVTFVFGLSDSGNHPSIQQRLSMANDWVEAFDIMAGPPVPAPSSADGLKEEEFTRFSLDFPRIQVFLDVMPLTIQGYNDPMESLQEAYAKIMTLTDGNTAQAGGVLRVLTQLMGNALQGELEKSPLFQLSERSIAKAEGVRLGGSSLSPSNPDSVFRIRKSEDGTIIIKMLLLNEQVEKAFDIRSGKFVVFDAALSSAFIETGIGVNKIGEVFSEGFVKGMLVGTATAIVGGSEAEERKDHLKTKNNADSQSQGKLTEKRVVVQDLDRRRVGELQRYA